MSGRLYSAGGEVLVEDQESARNALLATLAAAVGMLVEAHELVLEGMLRDGLTPTQRHNVGERLDLARRFQEDILESSLTLWGQK